MWDLLVNPAKTLIKGGINARRKSEEMKNLTIAVQDRIRREARFNARVLDELSKGENGQAKYTDNVKVALVQSLRTDAFDDINNNSAIPISLFFAASLEKEKWPNWKNKNLYLEYRACPEFCVNGADIKYRRGDLRTRW